MFPSIASAADTCTWTGRALVASSSDGWAAAADWLGRDVPSGSVGEVVFPTH